MTNQVQAEVWRLMQAMTDDELWVLARVATKLMGEGRREYGALDMATEKRTHKEMMLECSDEAMDAAVYAAMAARRAAR